MSLARKIRNVRALALLAVLVVGCTEPTKGNGPAVATITQGIATEDSLGTNSSAFFPIGFYMEGHQIDEPLAQTGLSNGGFFIGGSPSSGFDAARFYNETFLHMRSMGMNTLLSPNVDTIDWNTDYHLTGIVSAANALGNFYPIPSSRAVQQLTTTPIFQQNTDRCQAVTDGTNGTAAQAVSTMLAAANAFTCVGGSNAGAYCNNYICQTTGSLCCSNPGICSPNQAFANFYVQDEPGEACLPALRTIGKYLALYDPSHSGISNFSTLFSDPDAQPYPHNSYYRSMLFDKVLG